MNLTTIRRALHHIYTVALLALLASGLLLGFPDLRALVVGGYGREIFDVHVWLGVAFVAVPLLAVAAAPRSLWTDTVRRLGPPDGLTWRKAHIVISLVAGVVLAVSGLLLWLDPGMSLAVSDVTVEIHEQLTYLVTAVLGIHLVAARRQIVVRTREIALGEEEPLFSFDDELDESER